MRARQPRPRDDAADAVSDGAVRAGWLPCVASDGRVADAPTIRRRRRARRDDWLPTGRGPPRRAPDAGRVLRGPCALYQLTTGMWCGTSPTHRFAEGGEPADGLSCSNADS